MTNPAVSIIIPAYNAAPFIEECLASVASQTFEPIEVIVVNDASTDGTGEIAERFIKGKPKFKLINLDRNLGLSGARNAGIRASNAEYLFFLDADDCLYPQAIEALHETLTANNAAVVRAAFKRGRIFQPRTYDHFTIRSFDYHNAMKVALYQKRIMSSACGMIISKKLLLDVDGFRPDVWYEDLDTFYRFYEHAGKIILIEQPLYFYRKNATSFLHRWSDSRLDVLDVTDRMATFFDEKYPHLSDAAHDRRFSAHFNILIQVLKHDVDNEEVRKRCLKVIKESRKRALKDRNVRLKNKIGALASYGGMPLLRMLSKL